MLAVYHCCEDEDVDVDDGACNERPVVKGQTPKQTNTESYSLVTCISRRLLHLGLVCVL